MILTLELPSKPIPGEEGLTMYRAWHEVTVQAHLLPCGAV